MSNISFLRLRKRGLTWERFQQLIKGKLSIVPPEISCRHKSNMLRGGELEAMLGPFDINGGPDGDLQHGMQQKRFIFLESYSSTLKGLKKCNSV